jgi:all-trans-retinol dehydrogenase (NAD+)
VWFVLCILIEPFLGFHSLKKLIGIEAQARMVAYSASKYGVTGLMDGLHEELSINNLDNEIHTTCCHPYFISTRQELIESINESP